MPTLSALAAPSASPACAPCPAASLQLMGEFRLVVLEQDCTARLNYDKVRLMLSVLALAPAGTATRAQLAAMIWPDAEAADGRARVRHALHTLRQAFSLLPEALASDSSRITLRTDLVRTDVLDLLGEGADGAATDDAQRLALYQGPLLGTLSQPPSDTFLNWQRGWQARIEIDAAQCRQRLIDHYTQAGDLGRAITATKHWIEQWPEDEACHRQLIRLLLQTGQQDAATLAFEHCSRVLNERLGVAPAPETQALLGITPRAAPIAVAPARRHERDYRPLAVLAVTLCWRGPATDAEPAVDILAQARRAVHDEIRSAGAWASGSDGNTLLAYLGYPALSERPIEAAMALARRLADLPLHESLGIGIGLHADIALTDAGTHPDAALLLGQAVLPLSWQARHRETLLSQSALQRLPARRYAVLKRGGRTDYLLEHQPPSTVVPRLHGLSREFDHLAQQWMRLQPGRPPIAIVLNGFAGIGKSLLADAMAEYALKTEGQCIRLECVDTASAMPLQPVLCWLHRQIAAAGTRQSRDPATPDADYLSETLGLKPAQAAIIAPLLGAQGANAGITADTLDALHAALTHQAPQTGLPRLIVIENLQWADTATLALIRHIKGKPARIPLMLLATSRDTPGGDLGHLLRLKPLNDLDMAQFVTHRARQYKLSRKQRQHVIKLSHGVPLYALQLIRQTVQGLPLDHSSELTDILCLAMRRLEPGMLEIAQLAVLLDEPLEPASLSRILAQSQDGIDAALARLEHDGILMTDAGGRRECPILVRLALRRIVPRRTAQRLHALIARHMIDTDQPPPRIAPHIEQADDPATPLWWQRAAHHELQENQVRRAKACVERALQHSHRIDTSEARRQFEFDCQLFLGDLTSVTTGPGADQAARAYAAASRLTPSNDAQAILTGLWGQWLVSLHTGQYTQALELARRHLRLAGELAHPESQGWGYYAIGQTYLWCGHLTDAEQALQQSIELLQGLPSPSWPSTHGDRALPLVHATLALCYALQGSGEQAQATCQHAIALAAQEAKPLTMALCLLFLARLHYLGDDVAAAAAVCEGMLAHFPPVEQPDEPDPWRALLQAYALLPRVLDAQGPDALDALRATLPAVQQGMPTLLNSQLCLIARGLIAQQRFDEALALLDQADEINRSQSSYTVEPEILCLRGDIWLASGQLSQARQAWSLARENALHRGLLAYAGWADRRMARYA